MADTELKNEDDVMVPEEDGNDEVWATSLES